MKPSQNPSILICNQKIDINNGLRQIKHILFDFDGTLSVLRRGWEEVMYSLMVEVICGDHEPNPEIEEEVRDYIDRSTGILTIQQMQWLSETVARYGMAEQILTADIYKKKYLKRLMKLVNKRIKLVESGKIPPHKMMVSGAQDFLEGLSGSGTALYLASGTDHDDVVHEAHVLGLGRFFKNHIYGAKDKSDKNHKDIIIQRILEQNQLQGHSLLVVGDGPIEIREANKRNAIALGVASDEEKREGWNKKKIERLTNAQADFIIPDFSQSQQLLAFM